jgi:hypothetical protein
MVLLHASDTVVRVVGLAIIGYALALAAMGAVTACALLSSMARGRYEFPTRVWLPLPRSFRASPTRSDDVEAPG